MSEFKPVSTLHDLKNLDDDEILDGYRYGQNGGSEPGSDKSRGFWHGWRNAQADLGKMQADVHQIMLAREFVGKYKGFH